MRFFLRISLICLGVYLNISGCKVTNQTLTSLAVHCQYLESIKLLRCRQITDSAVVTLIQHCFLLSEIHVCFTNLTDVTINAIAIHCKNLISLALFSCERVTAASLTNIVHKCLKLRTLRVFPGTLELILFVDTLQISHPHINIIEI